MVNKVCDIFCDIPCDIHITICQCSDIWRKNEMSVKKTRVGKITRPQKQKLLELMRGNRRVALGLFGGPNSAKQSQSVWEMVAEELNGCGGARKTADQWKKSWSDWKGAVKKQQSAILRFQNLTGNRPASEGPPHLEGMDAEVLDFYPIAMVDGDGQTQEGGFILEQSIVELETENQDLLLEKEIDDLIKTPTSTPKALLEKPTFPPAPRLAGNSFYSALEDLKKEWREQEERRNAILKDMLAALNSMDNSLKTLAENANK